MLEAAPTGVLTHTAGLVGIVGGGGEVLGQFADHNAGRRRRAQASPPMRKTPHHTDPAIGRNSAILGPARAPIGRAERAEQPS